jgi:cell division septum initiation protein DivIVA
MDTIETGKDKVKKICEVLRKETIEPAIAEAKHILQTAQENADQIIEEAKRKAAKLVADAEKDSMPCLKLRSIKEPASRSNGCGRKSRSVCCIAIWER